MPASEYKVLELGELHGEVLLFGGPYSNLQASTALLEWAEARGIPPKNRICTGDIVAYCANPVETWRLWQDHCVLVAGNCEKQLGLAANDCGCGFDLGSKCEMLSRVWFPFARTAFSTNQRKHMAETPDVVVFTYDNQRYAVIHGGLSDVAKFIWPTSDTRDFVTEIKSIRSIVGPIDGIIAGHCGIPFQRNIGGVNWINPGAIGMPAHNGDPRTFFGVLAEAGFEQKRLSYDHEYASGLMKAAGLNQGYETAVLTGFWPSTEIFPPEMEAYLSSDKG